MQKAVNKISTKQIVFFVISFAMAYYVATYFLSQDEKSPNEMLLDVSTQMNKSMPKMVDAETRLDSTSADGMTLNYHYTLINQSKDNSVMDFELVKTMMTEKAQKNLDSNPIMKDYRDNNISLHYIFKDKNQNQVFDYTVEYQKK